MPDWITIPPFVDDKYVKDKSFSDIFNNLRLLKSRNMDDTFDFISTVPTSSITISSSEYISINPEKYLVNIETRGGVVICGGTVTAVSSGAGVVNGQYTVAVDGVLRVDPSANDIRRDAEASYYEMLGLMWVLDDLSAGSHTIELYARKLGTDNLVISDARRNFFWAMELGQ